MPLFEKKTARKDVTRHWVGDVRLVLEFDFAEHSLSGVNIGGILDRLSRLGPAEDPEAAVDGIYRYFSRGVEILAEGGIIQSIRLLWVATEGFHSYRGVSRQGEAFLALGSQTNEGDLTRLFGPPYWRDQDEDEVLLFYEFGPVEWQIELAPEGTLAQWTILTPPLMADPEQRQTYGVTKPWPPDGRIRPKTK